MRCPLWARFASWALVELRISLVPWFQLSNSRLLNSSFVLPIEMRFSSIVGIVVVAVPVFISALAISTTPSQSLNAFGKRDVVSEILNDIEDAITCVACNV
jgi:hypothetical protein